MRRVQAGVMMVWVCVTGCGGNGPSGPSGNPSATVTLNASGVSPTEVRVSVGGTVEFVNNDTRPHEMSSDPITLHSDCPAINSAGTLGPGQRRSTAPLTIARTCGFHDHFNENDPAWKGRIVVQ